MTRTASPSAGFEQTSRVHAGGRAGIDSGYRQIDRTRRTEFGGAGCNIYGWPPDGGVIIRPEADAIELQYLGLDRLEPQATRFRSQEDENALCLRLINIGGKWWPSERRAALVWRELNCMVSGMEDETDEEMMEVWIGWTTSGGILVSEFHSRVGEIKTPDDIGRLRIAQTMEERCELPRTKFEAVYYEHPQDYAGFSNQHAVVSRDGSMS